MSLETQPPIVPLVYTVAGCSEHSGRYVAENILVDNPVDQGSRWSGAYQASNNKQWMLLRLDQLSVLKTLTFGKFHRAHPCNMKEFKLFVGETKESLSQVITAGLRNDHVAETFSIRHVNSAGVPFPTRYVKIVPLSAHGQSFHTSIWHVKMTGITDDAYVQQARTEHEEYKESMILRHILKHLRQRRLLGPYQSILSRTGFGRGASSLRFEHPILSSLHNALVLGSRFSEAETLLESCASNGLFSSSVLSFQPTAAWSRINSFNDLERLATQPSARGGHAMCLDKANGLIYMFGGWDGKKNLQDFWVWNIHEMSWNFLGSDGPTPRACHKLVFNEQTGDIYLFGRFDETISSEYAPSPTSSTRTSYRGASEPLVTGRTSTGIRIAVQEEQDRMSPTKLNTFNAEFYCYRTRGPKEGYWDIVSPDTQLNEGPPLVYDHQMLLDNEAQTIYISGGRVIDGDWNSTKYSGLYSYDLRSTTWTLLHPTHVLKHPHIPARFGHSMVLDPRTKTLFIFGGQRDEKYLADMYAYDIPTRTITQLYPDFAAFDGPNASFTQRAVIDPDLKEIYVFCGLTKGPPGSLGVPEAEAPYWVYRYERPERRGTWTKILSSTPAESSIPPTSADIGDVPVPRYAHQVVYDASTKTIYMHGGNPSPANEAKGFVVTTGDSPVDSHRDSATAVGDGEGNADGETRYRVLRGSSIMAESAGDRARETYAHEESYSRLDDFWTMRLQRHSSAEIVRRGKYLIRQQQFREMCEDTQPVKALAYLQTEVSSVVDHSDSEEARMFRSLLSHLLTPAAKPTSVPVSQQHTQSTGKESKLLSIALLRTGVVDEDDIMEEATPSSFEDNTASGPKQPVITLERVPEEETLIGDQPSPSPERYKQRTEIFESLMEYVNEEARQPGQNLWDIIDLDQLDERQ